MLLKCDEVKTERGTAKEQLLSTNKLVIKTVVIMISRNWVYMNKSNSSVGSPAQLDDGPNC